MKRSENLTSPTGRDFLAKRQDLKRVAACLALVSMPLLAYAQTEPCPEVTAACLRAGFAAGQAGSGKGLAVHCVDPIMHGAAAGTLASGSKLAIPAPSAGVAGWGDVVNACTQHSGRGSNPDVKTAKSIRYETGPVSTFGTYQQFGAYGFSWEPSDGQFGAIYFPRFNTYAFYGTAGPAATCPGHPRGWRVTTFSGTLDHLTGGNGCSLLFASGDGPKGWVFDRDYAGGGQVVPFALGDKRGFLMPFHGEFQWKNPSSPNHLCGSVPCFYSSLGLAVSTDYGKSFRVVGEIYQPSQPLSRFVNTDRGTGAGYGSLVVADEQGRHVDNPPRAPDKAYFYLFSSDSWPGLPGVCSNWGCLSVARAKYEDVINAALAGDPRVVASVFRKFDGTGWTEPATDGTPDLSGMSGKFAPLWTEETGGVSEVIYDRAFDCYLVAYTVGTKDGIVFKVRFSRDLLHWSAPMGANISDPGRDVFYPTLIGETGDPTIGGTAPRLYFSSTSKQNPGPPGAELKYVVLRLSPQ